MTNPQVESLLEHDAFLRALARRLLGDDAAADDVVQDAWIVALRSAKRPDEVRAGWLAGIVKNLVRRVRRDGERRARRERVVARADEVAPTDDACAERALRRRIVEIVVALPEIYREPLLLRYYDGLSPQAIAERLALPGSTVRTRIQRGLLRVRAHLENGNGNGHALALALMAIAAPRRARVLMKVAGIAAALVTAVLVARTPPPAPLHVAPRALAASPPAPLTPRSADAAPAVAVVDPAGPRVSVPLLLEGIVHLPEGAIEKAVRIEVDGVAADIAGDAPFAIPLAKEGTVHVRATHAESEPAESSAHAPGKCELWLRRRALVPEENLQREGGASGDALAAGGEGAAGDGGARSRGAAKGAVLEGIVRLPLGASSRPVLLEAWRVGGARVRANVKGGERFSLAVGALLKDPRPAELRIRASHEDAAPREAVVDVLFDPATGATVLPFVEIELRAPAVLEGVVDLEGTGPAADATVAVFPYDGDAPARDLAAAARTGPDGRFRLVVDRGLSYFVAAAAPGYAPSGASAVLESDATLAPLVLRGGATIEGRVRTSDQAAAGASVRSSLPGEEGVTLLLGPENALAYEAGGVAWRSVVAETDAGGSFRIRGLAPRTYRVEVEALGGGAAPRYGALEVVAPATVEFEVPVARLSFVVRGAGAPVAGAMVEAFREDKSLFASVTDGEGRALLLARPGERLHLVVSGPEHASEERDVVAETSEISFDLVPEKRFGAIVVALHSADGLPLPAACDFELVPDRGRMVYRRVLVEDGRFLLRDLEPGAYRVLATLPGNFVPASGRVVLGNGGTSALSLPVQAGGRIVLRILTGGDLPDVWLEGSMDSAGQGFDRTVRWTITGDVLESGLMEPGIYVVHVLAANGPRSFPVALKPGETVRLLVPVD